MMETAPTSQIIILTAPPSQVVILEAGAPGIHAATGTRFDGFLGAPLEPSRAPQRRGMDPRGQGPEDDDVQRTAPRFAADAMPARRVDRAALFALITPTIPTPGEF
jgi:hypothetical protein